jgi:NAD(P)-dependent dehydrogenase (short-subunit alcohol dehydrogenase family)
MKIFITGSADGLGYMAAKTLLGEGHEVVVHARSKERLAAVQDLVALGAKPLAADISDLDAIRVLAQQVNELGTMDAVIHNAGLYSSGPIIRVNVVAPYILTALMHRPKRLIYISSGLHSSGRPNLAGIKWTSPEYTGSYSDSKLFITTLSTALAKRWPDVLCNAVDPGWVPTKMGGANATDNLREGHQIGRASCRERVS